jgi:hypothetical protein
MGRTIFLAVLLCSLPARAADQPQRFIEIHAADDTSTRTYDLDSVELIQPDKFTIRGTDVDDPDIIALKINALEILRPYCKKRDGDYDAPAALFRLGTPDLAIERIQVRSKTATIAGKKYPTKQVLWEFPYDRLAIHHKDGQVEAFPSWVDCQSPLMSPDELYLETRSAIMNGIQVKEMYDCRRFVMGMFLDTSDPSSKAVIMAPRGGYVRFYLAVCQAVTGKAPYLPQ